MTAIAKPCALHSRCWLCDFACSWFFLSVAFARVVCRLSEPLPGPDLVIWIINSAPLPDSLLKLFYTAHASCLIWLYIFNYAGKEKSFYCKIKMLFISWIANKCRCDIVSLLLQKPFLHERYLPCATEKKQLLHKQRGKKTRANHELQLPLIPVHVSPDSVYHGSAFNTICRPTSSWLQGRQSTGVTANDSRSLT